MHFLLQSRWFSTRGTWNGWDHVGGFYLGTWQLIPLLHSGSYAWWKLDFFQHTAVNTTFPPMAFKMLTWIFTFGSQTGSATKTKKTLFIVFKLRGPTGSERRQLPYKITSAWNTMSEWSRILQKLITTRLVKKFAPPLKKH